MYRILFLTLMFSIIFLSCKKNSNNTTEITPKQDSSVKVKISENVKNIIYLTPSPSEIMLIINNANPEYYDSFLNPVSNVDNYETIEKIALNLGIYTSDLSFLSMYEQAQKSINYVAASKKLAEKLGLLDYINDSTLTEIQNNLQDRDKVLNIITEIYDDLNTYLAENNQEDISTLIIYGAWIEGLYIAINLTNNDFNKNKELISIINDQRISLEELIEILKIFEQDKRIKKYYKQAKEIMEIYKQAPNEQLDKKTFEQLSEKINAIRNQIIS